MKSICPLRDGLLAPIASLKEIGTGDCSFGLYLDLSLSPYQHNALAALAALNLKTKIIQS
jgi:hypothetical protein